MASLTGIQDPDGHQGTDDQPWTTILTLDDLRLECRDDLWEILQDQGQSRLCCVKDSCVEGELCTFNVMRPHEGVFCTQNCSFFGFGGFWGFYFFVVFFFASFPFFHLFDGLSQSQELHLQTPGSKGNVHYMDSDNAYLVNALKWRHSKQFFNKIFMVQEISNGTK